LLFLMGDNIKLVRHPSLSFEGILLKEIAAMRTSRYDRPAQTVSRLRSDQPFVVFTPEMDSAFASMAREQTTTPTEILSGSVVSVQILAFSSKLESSWTSGSL
jgi:hypothetical protein